jgi:hypothetical protein
MKCSTWAGFPCYVCLYIITDYKHSSLFIVTTFLREILNKKITHKGKCNNRLARDEFKIFAEGLYFKTFYGRN